MSQVSSAGATLTNNITPWSRTPGKPSTGTGILGPCSSNRWQTNCKNSNSVDLSSARRDETAIEDLNTDFDNFVGTGEQPGHMWPPPIFDAARVTDSNASSFPISPSEGSGGSASNQWSVSQFAGGTNSLLGAPGAPPTGSSGSSVCWPVRGSDVTTACVPRAITGQQQQQLLLGPSAVPSADSNRRFPTGASGWPLSPESADLLSGKLHM
ncbi:hypothetical protein FBUS_11052 [Fasciolopsis buskii]|uniref:Uncharacterized protein n=1 Tax=Fasciolopsis buskii TaxID=27845 RepID=A0A8E0RWA8_9TREM|nr:hypothetical protein FBUS_11052 [Fasciolopsis buski]